MGIPPPHTPPPSAPPFLEPPPNHISGYGPDFEDQTRTTPENFDVDGVMVETSSYKISDKYLTNI